MESNKYVTFNNHDIIEALQDLYQKNTGKKIDIRFDESNERALRSIRNITIKIGIEGDIEKWSLETPEIGISFNDIEEKAMMDTNTSIYPPQYR